MDEMETLMNAPKGVQMALLPLEDLESAVDGVLSDRRKAQVTKDMFESVDIDLGAFTQGMTDEDRVCFLNLFGLQVAAVDNYTVGATLMILWRKYLIPMAQRKQALERMIIALGKGEDDAKGQTEEN